METHSATKKGFCDEQLGKLRLEREYRWEEVKSLVTEIGTLNAKRDKLALSQTASRAAHALKAAHPELSQTKFESDKLMECKDIGFALEESGEQESVSFTAGEHFDRAAGPLWREKKVLEVADHMTRLALDHNHVVAISHIVDDRPLKIELVT